MSKDYILIDGRSWDDLSAQQFPGFPGIVDYVQARKIQFALPDGSQFIVAAELECGPTGITPELLVKRITKPKEEPCPSKD